MPRSGHGGVVSAPCGDAVVAVDLTERHVAVYPSGQQFGGGVRPQRPGIRGGCSVQESAGAEHRIGACSRELVDPAGGLGGGGWTAEDGGPEFCRDAGVGDEEGLTCGFDRGGDGRSTVSPPAVEDANMPAAQRFWPAKDWRLEVVCFVVTDELNPLAGLSAQVAVDDVDDLSGVGATMDQITDLDDEQILG